MRAQMKQLKWRIS